MRVPVLFGVLIACSRAWALNPALDISQYGHDTWTVRSGFIKGYTYGIAQTADGYLWLATEAGAFRFDGVRTTPWQPPPGQKLPEPSIFRLLGARDGTLWIGTFAGLASWKDGKLTRHPELDGQVVGSLIEDHEGTVWAGSWQGGPPSGWLCAFRNGGTQCYGQDGMFGNTVSSLYEDRSGVLWAGTASGIWRWKPGPPKRYPTPPMELTGLVESDDGRPIVAAYGAGLLQLSGDKVEPYPIRAAADPAKLLRDHDINSNKLLRDRDGGLWLGTVERGLIHVHQGRTDIFTRADGLSADVILSLFEDREGNIWVATTGGLDRFRELPVTTITAHQWLSSDAIYSVLATTDGSVWVSSHDGLTRWKDGQSTTFRKVDGLPSDTPQSLFEDDRGRVWASTVHGLAYFQNGRFVAVNAPGEGEAYCITGDRAGNLWLSENRGLLQVREGHLVDQSPWPEMGRHQQAKVILADPERGGIWLGFWTDGGVLYFKDRQVRAMYTAANGLGEGHVPDVRLDRDGALWASTERGGLSRIKDNRISTLTTRNGLPCDTVHWSIEGDDRSLWLLTACGLVRIARAEVDAWVADPKHHVQITFWDATDGVRLRAIAATPFRPPVAKSTDGKLWFVSGEALEVVDPDHLRINKQPPPVHIEQVTVNGKPYQLQPDMRLPANTRDLWIDYTALSLVAPEKVHFKYMLEGQDLDWKEVINDRQVQYSNLRPRKYRFRVIASNDSGVWNDTGDTLEFSIDPRFYQTAWFDTACVAALLGMIWGLHRLRLHQVAREFNARTEERVEERTRIARELHDTLLQSFQGLMFSFQAARNLLPARTEEAIRTLDGAIREGDEAITEGRNAIQGLRADPALESSLEHLLTSAGKELARSMGAEGESPAFQVTVEGARQPLSPLLQDDVYRIAREVLRNAFHHAHASRIEADIAYDRQFFRLRIRDNGKGIDPAVLGQGGRQGHWGLPGIRERAKRIGAQFKLWSELGAGTEAELTVPARIAYGTKHRKNKAET